MSEFETVSESELQSIEGGLLPLGIMCFLAAEAACAGIIGGSLLARLTP